MISVKAFQNLKRGDKVRVVSKWPSNGSAYQSSNGEMDCWLGKVITVDYVPDLYSMRCIENHWAWTRPAIDCILPAVEPVGIEVLI